MAKRSSAGNENVTTGVDQLVSLLNKTGKLSVSEASKMLNTSKETIEDWAEFLEQEGVLTVRYALFDTYLTKKTVSKKKQKEKSKLLDVEKKAFEKRSKGLITYFDNLEDQISHLNDILKHVDLKSFVATEIKELKKIEKTKKKIDRNLVDVERGVLKKLKKTEKRLHWEKKLVRDLFTDLFDELEDAAKIVYLEDEQIGFVKNHGKYLSKKLKESHSSLKHIIKKLEKKKLELSKAESKQLTRHLKRCVALEKRLIQEKNAMDDLLRESGFHEKELRSAQKKIVDKMKKYDQKLKLKLPKQVRQFLQKRNKVHKALQKLYEEEQILKRNLVQIVTRGKVVHSENWELFEQEIDSLNSQLAAIVKKRGRFERRFKKLFKGL